jgi:hypothetical protein
MSRSIVARIAGRLSLAAAAFVAGCNAPADSKPSRPTPPPTVAEKLEPIGAEAAAENRSQRAAENDAAMYMPLAADSRWEFDVTIELPLGAMQKAGAVTEVTGLAEIDGKTYYKAVMQVSGAPVNPKHVAYFRPSTQGLYQILEGEEEHGEWLYLPAKLEVGKKWSADTGKSTFNFEVIGRGDVDCQGKTYRDCLQLVIDMRSKFGSIKQELWLAPGVGPVKQVDHHTLFDSTAVLKKRVGGKLPHKSSE